MLIRQPAHHQHPYKARDPVLTKTIGHLATSPVIALQQGGAPWGPAIQTAAAVVARTLALVQPRISS